VTFVNARQESNIFGQIPGHISARSPRVERLLGIGTGLGKSDIKACVNKVPDRPHDFRASNRDQRTNEPDTRCFRENLISSYRTLLIRKMKLAIHQNRWEQIRIFSTMCQVFRRRKWVKLDSCESHHRLSFRTDQKIRFTKNYSPEKSRWARC
jgi:hypothetical protein